METTITTSDLLKKFDAKNIDANILAKDYTNKQRTSTKSGILKADAYLQYLKVMKKHKVETVKDIHKICGNLTFEQDIKSSVPNTCWIYRLRDNASSFSGGNNTRFASTNICDYIAFDDITRTLFLWELKSTKNTSVPLTMIRQNQIDGLLEASKHNLVAGLIINFRNEYNDTFFITIDEFVDMTSSLNKKSFNVKDLESIGAIRIESTKKRTRHTYNISDLIKEIHL